MARVDVKGSLHALVSTKYNSDKCSQPDSEFGLTVRNQGDMTLKKDHTARIVNRGGNVTINNTYYFNGQGGMHHDRKPEWIM